VMPAVDGTALLPDSVQGVPPGAPADPTPEQVAALIPPLIPKLSPRTGRGQDVVLAQPAGPQPAALPVPYQQGPQHPQRPRSVAGSGTIAALLLLTVMLAAMYPVLTAVAVICGIVVARVVDRSGTAMMRRRQVRGGRGRSDGWVTVLTSPVQLAVAVLITLPCLILPLLMAMICGAIVAVGLAAWQGLHWGPLVAGAVSAGALMGLLTAWWGPGGTSLRRGAHTTARAVLRPTWFRMLVVAAMIAVAVLCVTAVLSGTDTSWAPFGDPFDRSNLPDRPRLPDFPSIDLPFIGHLVTRAARLLHRLRHIAGS